MAARTTEPLIAGLYEVDAGNPLPGAGGGHEAYAVVDRRGGRQGLMAVRVRDGEAPRVPSLTGLATAAIAGVLTPVAHGVALDAGGRAAQFVICRAPPGPSLAAAPPGRRWNEDEIVGCVLRPVAAALAELDARRITHRAIRPDNVFQLARGQPVVLGCAWASVPGLLQPAVYEPISSAVCLPAGRGDGVMADDIYALGVLMLALAMGAQPLAGLDMEAVVARKLALGSFAGLVGEARVPPMIADLARSMTAEDPDHRPSPILLADPAAARARRVASRPKRRAQQAIEVGTQQALDARGLAYALARQPDAAARVLRTGIADRWLRRELGDAMLAVTVEEAVRRRAAESSLDESDADATMVLRAVAALDPLAYPAWRGLFVAPDGVGAALAGAGTEHEGPLRRLVDAEAVAAWSAARPERSDPVLARVEGRKQRMLLRMAGWTGGLPRLRYALNPLLPCRSQRLRGAVVIRLSDLLPALEAAAAGVAADERPDLPLDAEMAAFVAARLEQRMDADFAAMATSPEPGAGVEATLGPVLAQLRVLARLQGTAAAVPLPALAGWLAEAGAPALNVWRSRARQVEARAALAAQAALGRLPGVLAVLDDPAGRVRDLHEAEAATAELWQLDQRIAAAEHARAVGRSNARRLGQEIAAGCGTIAAAAALVMQLL